MIIKTAEFICSNTDFKKCPNTEISEFAFIGRSNVGKSSLINMLSKNKKLAKISAKPGKTQLINHFLINKEWYLVDLPGYGWAKVSKTKKEKWGDMTKDYLLYRPNLDCVFVLVDSRLEPQRIDLDFISWIGQNGIPFAIIFTKCDKLSKSKVQSSVALFKRTLLKDWEEMPQYFVSSSADGTGGKEILQFIEEVVNSRAKQ
ncbi:ribosome biogenesis GTP-binding protein YihA/YsxC [Fulvivirgaceae bacterium BMA10]|uniref:Probable GTP-binding protein EngB n=1 Tax=Splendidivirga corallicola TaxID=3051826 RepID=A0ABT8KRI0_9BACT|nr:ribosome biogenesis GTP-binding protein YihA/YsxC [Fulvivirgaceae bacterium BMA10]